jgi:DNA mismatch repair protein MutL
MITQLPENLVARIAAGEVVERPASVLKELIENSLDAGSTHISVEIKGSGRTLLRVSDNGSGMSRDDAHLCLKRHATSKISRYEDLEALSTFGFRGEALPSIAAVSRFRLATRMADTDSGWELILEGGHLSSEKPMAREVGTTIEVRDLFFNTPARFKFLKADFTERAQCLRVVEEMVFSSPHVSFNVQVEEGNPLVFNQESILRRRVAAAWGSKWQDTLVDVSAQEKHVSLTGVVSHQDSHAATPKNQYLYINRRPVHNRRLTRAIYDAYSGQLFVGRHPSWVLFLEVNPQAVDVNVHPSKREVKLAFESEIYGFVLNAVRRGLAQAGSSSLDLKSSSSNVSIEDPVSYKSTERQWSPASTATAVNTLYKPFESTTSFIPELSPLKNQTFRAVAQLNAMFIVAEGPDGMVIVDQHAAAEKALYEKLLADRQAQPDVQMMLVPLHWEVSMSLVPVVQKKLPELLSFGFQIEEFGGNTFLVKGYPAVLGEKLDLLSLLDGMTDFVNEGVAPFEHKMAALAACKGSVRAGDNLDIKACQFILDQLVRCEAPHTCPHGRPTLIQMSYPELERRFRRI